MPVINRIADFEPDMRAWRRHRHFIPELDFDLHETAAFVEARLREFGPMAASRRPASSP